MRDLGKAVNPQRVAIVVGVGLITATLILLTQRFLGSKDWEWAEALASLITLIATTIVIVGLLAWQRERHWSSAEKEDLRSLVLISNLIATGWSSPKDIGPTDLDPAVAVNTLGDRVATLEKSSRKLDELYNAMTNGEHELEVLVTLMYEAWTLQEYYLEGSRPRRLDYLSLLVENHLPNMVERRDDPVLFNLFVTLRYAVLGAFAAARHADDVIRERVLMDRPVLLAPYLDEHSEASTVDPVALLSRVISYATGQYDSARVERALTSKDHEAPLGELSFVSRCIGAVRNDMQWVAKALETLKEVLEELEPEIDESTDEVADLLRLNLQNSPSAAT